MWKLLQALERRAAKAVKTLDHSTQDITVRVMTFEVFHDGAKQPVQQVKPNSIPASTSRPQTATDQPQCARSHVTHRREPANA